MQYSLPYTSGIYNWLKSLPVESIDKIHDVYFSDPKLNPSARYIPEADTVAMWDELAAMKEEFNIHMQYVMNSSVWKNDVYSKPGMQVVIDNINSVCDRGVTMLTINNMLLLRDVYFRESLPSNLQIKLSINNKISSVDEIEFLFKHCGISHFILDRSINRNMEELQRVTNWNNRNKITVTLLAQEGCITKCPWKNTCDNMIATFDQYDEHEVNDLKLQHSTHFCTTHYKYNPQDQLKSPVITPVSVPLYEPHADIIKLAGRMVNIKTQKNVFMSYLNNTGDVNFHDITSTREDNVLSNTTIDDIEMYGYGNKVSNCKNRCADCDFCDTLYRKLCDED